MKKYLLFFVEPILFAAWLLGGMLPAQAQATCCVCAYSGGPNVCLTTSQESCDASSLLDADAAKSLSEAAKLYIKQNLKCQISTGPKEGQGNCTTIKTGGVCGNTPEAFASYTTRLAASPASQPIQLQETPSFIQAPILGVQIPGLVFSTPSTKEGESQAIPFLAQYISAAYKYLIGVSVIIAIIMVVYGGFRYLLGSALGDIKRGKEIIQDAIVGLILIFAAYVILQTINPATLNLSGITIPSTALVPTDDEPDAIASGSFQCATDADLVPITGIQNVSARSGDNRLVSTVVPALTKAGELAVAKTDPMTGQTYDGLVVFSAVRSLDKQQQLYNDAVAKHGEQAASQHVAKPSCQGPHLTGHAVDIRLKLGGKTLDSSDMTDARIDALQEIMTAAGWIRYCPEWWHFEFGLGPGPKRSDHCPKYGTGISAF